MWLMSCIEPGVVADPDDASVECRYRLLPMLPDFTSTASTGRLVLQSKLLAVPLVMLTDSTPSPNVSEPAGLRSSFTSNQVAPGAYCAASVAHVELGRAPCRG